MPMQMFRGLWSSVIEYETPRLVKIHNHKLGLVRRLIQFVIIAYVGFYALWLQRGYQEFCPVESSVTVKIKGVTKSVLNNDSTESPELYTRVWDVADYVVPSAENGAFFVATNVIITPNQTRGRCPDDHLDISNIICQPDVGRCETDPNDNGQWRHGQKPDTTPLTKCRSQFNQCPPNSFVFKAHGPLTGFCVPSDRPNSKSGLHVCEVESWCPVEIDQLPLGHTRALMADAQEYTVFVKNSVAFPYFGPQFVRNNLVSMKGAPCFFRRDPVTGDHNGCQIFKLGDMVRFAGGNFSEMAIKGGVVTMSISWNCNLDRDFMTHCLPNYSFRILDDQGWNFRHAKYHEENRRSLYKMYGIKVIVTVEGRGGKFNLKNTILNIGSGLALLGVSTLICDFLLMYIKEKGVIKQKKYDYIYAKNRSDKCPDSVSISRENGRLCGSASADLPRLMERDESLDTVLMRDCSTNTNLSRMCDHEQPVALDVCCLDDISCPDRRLC